VETSEREWPLPCLQRVSIKVASVTTEPVVGDQEVI
jgi:hypothetical protein